MPRRAQDVRAHDGARVERLVDVSVAEPRHAQAQRPFRAGIVLRLHRTEPRHHTSEITRVRLHEPLIAQAVEQDAASQLRNPTSQLQTSDFRLQTSDFGLRLPTSTSAFELRASSTSDFTRQTSNFRVVLLVHPAPEQASAQRAQPAAARSTCGRDRSSRSGSRRGPGEEERVAARRPLGRAQALDALADEVVVPLCVFRTLKLKCVRPTRFHGMATGGSCG